MRPAAAVRKLVAGLETTTTVGRKEWKVAVAAVAAVEHTAPVAAAVGQDGSHTLGIAFPPGGRLDCDASAYSLFASLKDSAVIVVAVWVMVVD